MQADDGVVLDDRHVLVGGGVIDRLDAVLGDCAADDRLIEDGAEHGDQLWGRRLLFAREPRDLLGHLHLDAVERGLGNIEEHQTCADLA